MRTKSFFGACLLVAVLAPAIIFGPRLYLQNKDAYVVGERFIRVSPEIQDFLGEIEKTSLAFGGASYQEVGPSGEAHFEVSVVGTKQSAKAILRLQKQGRWEVVDAQLLMPDGTYRDVHNSGAQPAVPADGHAPVQ